ncbi:MAG TPA: S41 family peptidase [Ktedonobacteraceae bacterium]|nr:S41 family peptidase [Ktedonobacteraceae bacterium]
MFLLLQGVQSKAATISRFATVIFVAFEIGYDTAVGLNSGIFVYNAMTLPLAQQSVVQQALQQLYGSPSMQQVLPIKVIGPEVTEPNVIFHYIAEDHIAHIQIIQLADGVSSQLKDTLSEAKKRGATSLILDLRDDPGGYVQEAINIASEFIAHGNVLFVQDSKGQQTTYPVSGNAVDTSIPLIVLVNQNTASAAEMLAGALQENNRAVLLGTMTFGVGTVLQEFDLSDGSAMLLATGAWLTPKSHFIQNVGLSPTINVALHTTSLPITANAENTERLTKQQILTSGDTQMAMAMHFLETHQAASTGLSQSMLSQQQPQTTDLLAFEPSFFPVLKA